VILWNCLSSRFEDGRHDAMTEGARAAGFDVLPAAASPTPRRGDVLLSWNLHRDRAAEAQRWRDKGGLVIVAEEGFTRGLHPVSHFSMARDGHNGAGWWPVGSPARWASLGLRMAPWRTHGGHILVCGQRGIGSPQMASPPGWHEDVARRLRLLTDRPVVVRPHPGKDKSKAVPLVEQLTGAWAVVVWSSAVATRALLMGIPVFFEAPQHVLAGAMCRDIRGVNNPPLPDRLPVFERMAWAQWSLNEIRAGEPFRRLCA